MKAVPLSPRRQRDEEEEKEKGNDGDSERRPVTRAVALQRTDGQRNRVLATIRRRRQLLEAFESTFEELESVLPAPARLGRKLSRVDIVWLASAYIRYLNGILLQGDDDNGCSYGCCED